jgi:hypothetical protein
LIYDDVTASYFPARIIPYMRRGQVLKNVYSLLFNVLYFWS